MVSFKFLVTAVAPWSFSLAETHGKKYDCSDTCAEEVRAIDGYNEDCYHFLSMVESGSARYLTNIPKQYKYVCRGIVDFVNACYCLAPEKTTCNRQECDPTTTTDTVFIKQTTTTTTTEPAETETETTTTTTTEPTTTTKPTTTTETDSTTTTTTETTTEPTTTTTTDSTTTTTTETDSTTTTTTTTTTETDSTTTTTTTTTTDATCPTGIATCDTAFECSDGTVRPCGDSKTCMCYSTTEGDTICKGDFNCNGLQQCSASTECPKGQKCVSETCCNGSFCVTPATNQECQGGNSEQSKLRIRAPAGRRAKGNTAMY